jgi:type III restriction enzyme
MRKLQDILDDISFDHLPPAWTTFDLAAFSHSKRLWDYQQAALENGLKALWKYYQDFGDYSPGEGEHVNSERQESFFDWYRDNGLEAGLDIPVHNARRNVRRLLEDYYPSDDGKILYEHFINRIGKYLFDHPSGLLAMIEQTMEAG